MEMDDLKDEAKIPEPDYPTVELQLDLIKSGKGFSLTIPPADPKVPTPDEPSVIMSIDEHSNRTIGESDYEDAEEQEEKVPPFIDIGEEPNPQGITLWEEFYLRMEGLDNPIDKINSLKEFEEETARKRGHSLTKMEKAQLHDNLNEFLEHKELFGTHDRNIP
jgi:hypothetical protein